MNWALREPIPWSADDARRASTVHVAEGMDGLTQATTQLAAGEIPARPFLVLGQYSMVDPSRSPEGTETAWAYTHVPQSPRKTRPGSSRATGTARTPSASPTGWRRRSSAWRPASASCIIKRHVQTPLYLERHNRNLVGGAINGGTAQLYQQAIFRPFPGLGRPTTPVRGLYLASSSAHPGGGLHGGPGGNAARTALWHGPAQAAAALAGRSSRTSCRSARPAAVPPRRPAARGWRGW